MIKIIKSATLTLLLVLTSQWLSAEVAVVVNVANNSDFDQAEIKLIYLGKKKSFSNGGAVSMYDLPEGDENRSLFAEKVLRKNPSRLNSYWARMLFSSKANPPKVVNDAEAIKNIIAREKNAIAYINVNDVDSSVKVVYTVSE